MADPGGAGVSNDVGVELVAEVPGEAREGERCAALVVAQGAGDYVGGEVGQPRDLVAARLAVAEARSDLGHAAQPDPARDRLAAGFVGAETGQDRGEVDDAGVLVDDHDRARADWAPGLFERVVVEGVPSASAEGAARRPPTRTALSLRLDGTPPATSRISRSVTPNGTSAMPGWATAPEIWTRTVPANARAAVSAKPACRRHDRGDGGERLRAVDQRGLAEEAAGRGVRRLLLGLAALALEALEQDRLLAQHVGALERPEPKPESRGRVPRTLSPR